MRLFAFADKRGLEEAKTMLRTDVVLVPHTVAVRVTAAPVFNILNTMMLFNLVELRSGLSDFVVQTAAVLPVQIKRNNEIASHLLDAIEPTSSAEDFDTYIRLLRQVDFGARVQKLMGQLCHKELETELTAAQLLASKESFVTLVVSYHRKKGDEIDASLLGEVHDYLNNPTAAVAFLVQHLQMMWDTYLKQEWYRIASTLEETVRVFHQLDLSDLTPLEAVQAVTGRDMTGFVEDTEEIDEIIFVPSLHCGPYVTRFEIAPRRLGLLFGARVPEGVPSQSLELSLRDLMIQLSALNDDTRLHILELLTHHRELCSADFQQMLNLSQSSASRHLRQLVASGFLDERRRDLNKYFSLNTRRIQETSAAIKMMFARRG